VLNSFNFKLDTGLLHPLVLEKIGEFSCNGTIKSIQVDLFKPLTFLQDITFGLRSLGNFYHQIGIKWMNSVNVKSNITLFSINIPYKYPDRDFCIFATQFPRNKSITLILDDPGPNGTLTFLWLCRNGAMIKGNEGNTISCNNWTVNQEKIGAMLKLCEFESNSSKENQELLYPSYTDYYQTRLIEMFCMQLIPR
jgi:hypothetical protein